ncbi:MAG: Gfo/Idh/MocA family oxidoreductase [Pirellulaceae bacterium]
MQCSKRQRLAKTFAVPHVYRDLRELLDQHELDFVDIVTSVETHASLAMTALQRGVAVICQKPLADSLEVARGLCRRSRELAVPLLVHENFRWQQPIRCLKAVIDSGELGELVLARIDFAHSFPIFDNQPALKLLDKLILADVGTHILTSRDSCLVKRNNYAAKRVKCNRIFAARTWPRCC